MYLDWWGIVNHFVNTILGLAFFYLLLLSDRKVWTWVGFWTGVLWFWWISMSFVHYEMAWAIPISVGITGFFFGLIFFFGVWSIEFIGRLGRGQTRRFAPTGAIELGGKVIFLLILSYIHPFAFDWYKPELVFTNSYIGIEKWQFALVLVALALTIYKKQLLFLLLILTAYPYTSHFEKTTPINPKITISHTDTSVKDKWNQTLLTQHIRAVFKKINKAIKNNQEVIVLPESVMPLFLNEYPQLMTDLEGFSNDITIVIGSLYWENNIPRNSTYIFKNGTYTVANKVVLVPFGEYNPLPKWLGKWINKLFFDGAPDYKASGEITDYDINGTRYRNAICYEACSEELYEGKPKNMIVITNNGWLVPSIEPTQQKIMLQYYSKKYGTTIYHSVNMSPSYIVQQGKVILP